MTYKWRYKVGDKGEVERIMARYKGKYGGGTSDNVGIDGPYLLLTEDALSSLEKICKKIDPRIKASRAKPYAGR